MCARVCVCVFVYECITNPTCTGLSVPAPVSLTGGLLPGDLPGSDVSSCDTAADDPLTPGTPPPRVEAADVRGADLAGF